MRNLRQIENHYLTFLPSQPLNFFFAKAGQNLKEFRDNGKQ
jgi:hypothetical protein